MGERIVFLRGREGLERKWVGLVVARSVRVWKLEMGRAVMVVHSSMSAAALELWIRKCRVKSEVRSGSNNCCCPPSFL